MIFFCVSFAMSVSFFLFHISFHSGCNWLWNSPNKLGQVFNGVRVDSIEVDCFNSGRLMKRWVQLPLEFECESNLQMVNYECFN